GPWLNSFHDCFRKHHFTEIWPWAILYLISVALNLTIQVLYLLGIFNRDSFLFNSHVSVFTHS
ncbi:hypothetical protein, partial [Lentilactobacillus hilgardii]|uniref:hypothetical protein n=1 Tax=Lentilactobacillus hilgardii TaxID=1588 RepID=UPI0021A91B6E